MDKKDKQSGKTMNFSVRGFEASQPKIREDLKYKFDSFRGDTYCIIEDPIACQFFRTGVAEYHFIKNLDGKNTVGEALAKMAENSGIQALSHEEAFQILNFLLESQLIKTQQSVDPKELNEAAEKTRFGKLQSEMNPLFMKIPLTNPDEMLNHMKFLTSFFMGKFFFIIWLCVMIFTSYQVMENWNLFTTSSVNAFLPKNWIWIFLSWIVLKMAHESFHAFACKRFGANVPEAGVMLILFAPMTYVDASSSWRLTSKWKRMMIGAAGIYIELFLAAIGALVWLHLGPGTASTVAYNFMLTGSVITLFFNANPLMRFDGYYILSDYFEIPNLYTRSQQKVQLLAKKLLLGVDQIAWPSLLNLEDIIIMVYGCAALVWRFLIVLSLFVSCTFLFKGIGVIFAAISLIAWFWVPFFKIIRYIGHGNEHEIPRIYQYIPRLAISFFVLMFVAFVPYKSTLKAPLVFYSLNAETVRSDAPGFIIEHPLNKEELVNKGELLMKLQNDDEVVNLKMAQIELQQAKVKSDMYLVREPVRYQAEKDTITALNSKITELDKYVQSLTITAPKAGLAVPSSTKWEDNKYIQSGDQLFTIFPEKSPEAMIVVSQDDSEDFQAHIGKEGLVKLTGTPIILKAKLNSFIPRATTQLPHPALSALNGGPLAVLPPKNDNNQKIPQLIAPHFVGSVTMDLPNNLNIYQGATGILKFEADNSKFVFQMIYERISRYVEKIIERARNKSEEQ